MIKDWLSLTSVFRCVLVEIDYKEAGVIKTACFARGNFRSAGTDTPAYTPYRDFVVGGLQFASSIDAVLFGQSQVNLGDVELMALPETEVLLARAVAGHQIRLYIGEESWTKAEFYQLATVVSQSVEASSNAIRVTFRDFSEDLNSPVLSEKTDDGVLLPRCFGRAFNIKPLLIDALTHTYQFNTEPSQAVTAVKFNGDILSTADYLVDLTNSTITFSVMPIGEVTLDVDGTKTVSWLQTAGEIITYLFPTAVIDAGVSNALLGLYISDEMSLSELLDEVTSSIGAFWRFDAFGVLHVKPFIGLTGTTVRKLTDDHNEENSREIAFTLPPAKSVTLGYARNFTPLKNVAGNVYTTDAAMAERLQQDESTISVNDSVIEAAYNNAAIVSASTLLVNKADADAEAARRLAISNQPRVIYETKQLAAGFGFELGDEVTLTTPGLNGTAAIIIRKDHDMLNDAVTLEFWQ